MNNIHNTLRYFQRINQLKSNGLFLQPSSAIGPTKQSDLSIILERCGNNKYPSAWRIVGNLFLRDLGEIRIREEAMSELQGVMHINKSSYHCEPSTKRIPFFRVDLEYNRPLPHINAPAPWKDHMTEFDTGLMINSLNTVSAIWVCMAYLRSEVYPLTDVDKYNKIITCGRT